MMQGSPYRTSNRLIAYPLASEAAGFPLGILVDASFSVPAVLHDSGIAPKLVAARIESGALVLTVSVAPVSLIFTVEPSDGWITTTASSEVEIDAGARTVTASVTGTLLLHGPSVSDAVAASVAYAGTTPFEARTVYPETPAVRSILCGDAEFTSKVTLTAGYNIILAVQGSDTISISAGVGAGAGREPCGGELRTGNLTPDADGAIIIRGDGCFNITPSGAAELTIDSKCQACCTCNDYATEAWKLKALGDVVKATKATLDAALELYSSGVAKHNAQVAQGPDTQFSFAVAVAENSTGTRRTPRYHATALLSNRRTTPVRVTAWTVKFPPGVIRDDVRYTKGDITRSINLAGNLPVIGPGETLVVGVLGHGVPSPGTKFTATGTFKLFDPVTERRETLSKTVKTTA